MTTNSLLSAALSYAKRGWAVFPLIPRGKTPRTVNGFKDASKSEEQIISWWTKWPEANIGIATGAVSNLVVLDFDQKSGGMETLESLSAVLPDTLSVHTGDGGTHLYYSHPGFAVGNKQGLKPGMDVRGDGGYVVAPESLHPNGNYYQLESDSPPAYFPSWVASPAAPTLPKAKSVILADGQHGELAKATLRFCLQGSDNWHADMFKAVIDMKQQGYDQGECLEMLESGPLVMDNTHDVPLVFDVYMNREVKHPPRLQEPTMVSYAGEAPTEPFEGSVIVKASELSLDMLSFLNDKAKVKGDSTGIAGLDYLLGGGYRTGEVTCWHAEAKTGKNTLWHKLMYLELCKEAPAPMGYASRELTPETEVLPNLLSLAFKENTWLCEASPEKQEHYKALIQKWPMYFARGYGHFPLDEIRRWISELRSSFGVTRFWFDHLHYMIEDPEDHKAASKLIKEIKTIAKQEDVNVQIIIQPNKLMDGQKLSLNSIKGGAAMGQAIDNLLILERVKDQKNIARLTLEVGRSKLCKPGSIYLQYDPVTTDFEEAEFVPSEVVHETPVRKSWGKDQMLDG